MGSTKTNPSFRDTLSRFLQEGCYQFDDLQPLFRLTDRETFLLKSHIMKEFWRGNLKNALISFYGLNEAMIDLKERTNKMTLTREAFRCLLLPSSANEVKTIKPNINKKLEYVDLDNKAYLSFCKQDWGFYESLIKTEDLWISLYLPYLAINRNDLITVLKKNKWSDLVEMFPRLCRSPQKTFSTTQRNEWILRKYQETLKAGDRNISSISRKIYKEILRNPVMQEQAINEQTIRRIITRSKRTQFDP